MTPDHEPRYLSVANVLALHQEVMERTGFAPAPLRDEGLLESALMRPRMAVHYEGADLIRQCALLAVGITQAQAFLDGNKRTAFACARVFLRVNGLRFTGVPLKLAEQLESLGAHGDSLEEATARFEAWLRARVTQANSGAALGQREASS